MHARRLRIGAFATMVVLVSLLLLTGQAGASFGGFAFESTFGSFSDPESIAVSESTGDVYVYDLGKSAVEKFDASGNPVDFSGLSSNSIHVSGRSNNEAQIAVDNSSGPAGGDIYVATGFGVKIYGSDGTELGELGSEPDSPWGEPCGVAVDKSGSVYLGLYASHVNKYTPSANPVTGADYSESLNEVSGVCNVGVDPSGSVYVDTWSGARNGPVTKYGASQFGAGVPEGTEFTPAGGGTLAVANSFSGEAFVDRGSEIVQYSPSGSQLSAFGASGTGAISGSLGIAFNAGTGKLYVSGGASKAIEIWQGAVVLPSLQTDGTTNLDIAGSVTLNGGIEPEGAPVNACVFQYGTSASYESFVPCEQTLPLTGNGTVGVSAGISEVLRNNVYHYRLAAVNEHGIEYGADETFVILVPPAVAEQAQATSVMRASAELTGAIDTEQGDTAYNFEIGPTQAYGRSTPVFHTGSGASGSTTVSRQVGELLPSTTYHYRLVARNLGGSAVGPDHTFTTGAPTPPTAVTNAPIGISENGATISGAVDTSGLPTTFGFEIGTGAGYGPPTGLGAVGAGLSETPVALALTGLQPGTTYHYRLTATNVDGTSYGVDQTFTTGVFASMLATPPAPLSFVAVPPVAFPGSPKTVLTQKKAASKGKKAKKRGKAKPKGKKKPKGKSKKKK